MYIITSCHFILTTTLQIRYFSLSKGKLRCMELADFAQCLTLAVKEPGSHPDVPPAGTSPPAPVTRGNLPS